MQVQVMALAAGLGGPDLPLGLPEESVQVMSLFSGLVGSELPRGVLQELGRVAFPGHFQAPTRSLCWPLRPSLRKMVCVPVNQLFAGLLWSQGMLCCPLTLPLPDQAQGCSETHLQDLG